MRRTLSLVFVLVLITAFFVAALAQKSMVTNRIFQTGSLLAGFSLDYEEKGFGGIKDYIRLVRRVSEEMSHE